MVYIPADEAVPILKAGLGAGTLLSAKRLNAKENLLRLRYRLNTWNAE